MPEAGFREDLMPSEFPRMVFGGNPLSENDPSQRKQTTQGSEHAAASVADLDEKVKNDANESCARLPNYVILKVYVRIGGADESRPSVSKGRM